MKKWVIALGVAVSAASFALGTPIRAQQSVPEIPFDGDVNFLKLPPDMNFGEASGVAVNSKGRSPSSPVTTVRAVRRTAPPPHRFYCSTRPENS